MIPEFSCKAEDISDRIAWWDNKGPGNQLDMIKVWAVLLGQRGIPMPAKTIKEYHLSLDNFHDFTVVHEFAHHVGYLMISYLEAHPDDEACSSLPTFKRATQDCQTHEAA